MAYSDKVVDHYNNPRNVGSLPKEDPNVGTGLVGAPECGDVMKLQMKINPETQVIEEAKFKTFGCGSAIASSSLATEWVKGKTVDEALAIKNTDIVRELSLPPVKIHCSVLAEDAIKAAIGDWKKKHGVEVPASEKASHSICRSCAPSGVHPEANVRGSPKDLDGMSEWMSTAAREFTWQQKSSARTARRFT
jgi:nitrogen fixation protein NifU and related proteins